MCNEKLNEVLIKGDILVKELVNSLNETATFLNNTELTLDEKQHMVNGNYMSAVFDVLEILEEVKALSKIIDVSPVNILIKALSGLMSIFDDIMNDVQLTSLRLNIEWWFDNVVLFQSTRYTPVFLKLNEMPKEQ